MTAAAQRASALATSGVVLADLAAVRALFRTDGTRVWLLDEPLTLSCVFGAHFHVPCPGCGFTRGVVLAVHGRIADAFATFPAAPLLVLGLVALALALLAFAALPRVDAARNWPARLRSGGVAYLTLVLLVWAVSYGVRLSHVLRSGAPAVASRASP